MKTLLKLAVLALAGTAALALAGNALAVQKLSVTQSSTSLTIKISQAASDQQPARIGKPGREWCGGEAWRNLRHLACVGQGQWPIGDNRPCFRRRQVAGINLVAPTDFMLGDKILFERVGIVV